MKNQTFAYDIILSPVITEKSTNLSSRIFPNPAENSATVELQGVEGENIKFELYNILGEIVFKGNYKPTSNFDYYNIDLSLINNGIYNLVLRDGELLSTKKLQIIK